MNRPNPPVIPETTEPIVAPPVITPGRRTIWQRMGAGSLTISVLLHVILLVIGVFWILKVVEPPEKKVDFMPPAGGGGAPNAEVKNRKQQLHVTRPEMSRIAALNSSSSLVLPEPDAVSQLASLSSLSSGSLSGGLGGNGSGGGKGSGNGKGIGDGGGLGLGGGGSQNPFGMLSADKNSLVGNFYDLKQTKDGKTTGYGEAEALKVISEFITKDNWNPKKLEDYYKAPHTLYQNKFYMPIMSASLAPEAFGCGDKVQPVNWIALYRGMVIPPRSGKFRFVGRADNVMVVRFNRKVVLDGGDYSARLGRIIWDANSIAVLAGTSGNRDMEKEMRRAGYDIPVKSYHYASSGQYNERGGVMVGEPITVKAGQRYPVEILLSELGGLFGAALMIEEDGVKYDTEPSGAPILPLFRLSEELPSSPTEPRGSPAYDPKGPVWKVAPGEVVSGI